MNESESDDELGNPWLAVLIGLFCLAFTWYVYAKLGADPHLHGRASLANTGFGKMAVMFLSTICGIFFLYRGVAKIRSAE